MTSHPDKVFRGGLEHYRKPAPSSAWERIEANMDHKRNRSPWMKIAAGLILLIATSVLFLQRNQSDPATVADTSKSKDVNRESSDVSRQPAMGSGPYAIDNRKSTGVSRESAVDNLHSEVVIREKAYNGQKTLADNLSSPKYHSNTNPSSLLSTVHHLPSTESPEAPIASLTEPGKETTEPMPQSQVEVVYKNAASDIVQEQKRSNMLYTAEEVNEKFLKKDSTPEATPEKKNTSGLQKVIDRALDLRYEESVLADLREKKNEWLSLNLPSKQRETNK